MKNLLIICLLLSGIHGFGQSAFANIFDRLSFGLKAGGNYSDFTNANFDTEGLAGFHAGAVIAFRINDRFSIQEDFLFSTQGATLKGGLADGEELRLSYVTVPITVRYKTSFGLFFEAGPQVGILVDEDFKALGVADGTDFAEPIDAGMVGGIGYVLDNGLGISARYYLGFTKVTKIQTIGANSDFQNGMGQLSLFYMF